MKLCKYQHVIFRSILEASRNVGTDLITNGGFASDLTGWIADDYSWDTGTAAYSWTSGCYRGSIKQAVNVVSGTVYKLRFKYRATSGFDVIVRLQDSETETVNIYPEQTIAATADGLWHTVEIRFISNYTGEIYVLLGSRSTGAGDYGDCHDTGNAESGLYFDDVSLYEQDFVRPCQPCDVLIMDKTRDLEFQFKPDDDQYAEDLITNGDFATNPFFPVTLTTPPAGFSFDVDALPDEYWKEFVIYVCGKVIRVKRKSSGVVGYTLTSSGNVYEIEIKAVLLATFINDLVDGLNEALGDCGPTAVNSAGNTIALVPVTGNVYIWDKYNLLSNIVDDIDTSDVDAQSFIYDEVNKRMCYNYFTGLPVYFRLPAVTLESGKRYRLSMGYRSDYSDFTGSLTVYNGVNTDITVPFTVEITEDGTLDLYFTANYSGSHTLTINFTDPPGGLHYEGFCFDNVSLTLQQVIADITYKDCAGATGSLSNLMTSVGDTGFIQIPASAFPASTPFQIIITTEDGEQHISLPIQMIDTNDLGVCRDLLRLNWTDDCVFDCLDYSTFPFTNELFLNAYIVLAQTDKRQRESIDFHMHFNHSATRFELRIANYSPVLHQMLARAFEHKTIAINGESYYMDDDSAFSVSELGNGQYTGRITLVKSGTEVKRSSCCC